MRLGPALLTILLPFACAKKEEEATPSGARAEAHKQAEIPRGPCPPGAELEESAIPGGPRARACKRPDGTLHGRYVVTMPDGVVTAEGELEDGRETGPWIFRHPTGQTWKEGHFAGGLYDGTWRVYSSEGAALGAFDMKRGTGTLLTFWDSGGKRQEIEMQGGLRHGVMTWWRETGEKEMEAHYERGDLHGSWTYWDHEGQLRKIEDWDRDAIRGTVWYENGEPLLP